MIKSTSTMPTISITHASLYYSHHSCEKTPDGMGFLLNRAKDFLRWGTG